MLFLACSATVLLAAVYVLTPLFTQPKGNLEVELLAETELDRLLNRKAVIYTNLKELDFEFKMGRLSDGDHTRLETGYKNEAAIVLQKLDQLGVEKNIDEAIERDIAARKAVLFPKDEIRGQASASCPSCGAAIIPGKNFCADCGHKL